MKHKVFVINFGSTSTKIAVFEDQTMLFEETLRHEAEEIQKFKNSIAQKEYRLEMLIEFLKQNKIDLNEIDVFVGRGGLTKPVEGGTYLVNEQMLDDLSKMKYGDHVSNLGAIIAYELASKVGKKAYIVDPVSIDEMHDLARVTGFKGMIRKSTFHALNHKAVARRYAKEINKNYEDLNLIVCHVGGGVSIGLHQKGKVIDVNNALGGDGPYSPQRAGTLPLFDVIDYVYDSNKPKQEIKLEFVTKGGLYSYLKTASGIEICKAIDEGNEDAKLYMQALAYQINKEVGSLYFVNKGDIDAVIYTGGLIYQPRFTEKLKEFLPSNIVSVFYPGEDEMEALAFGGLRVAKGEEKEKDYK